MGTDVPPKCRFTYGLGKSPRAKYCQQRGTWGYHCAYGVKLQATTGILITTAQQIRCVGGNKSSLLFFPVVMVIKMASRGHKTSNQLLTPTKQLYRYQWCEEKLFHNIISKNKQ
jgi:hypothetical protein